MNKKNTYFHIFFFTHAIGKIPKNLSIHFFLISSSYWKIHKKIYLFSKCILLNVNVYGPTELKSLPHKFESVYKKWNVSLNGYFVFVYVLVNELG